MNSSINRLILSLLTIAPAMQAALVTIGNEADYNKQVVKSGKPSVIKFAADWCSVCQGVKKPYEEVAGEDEFAHVQFAQVNIDTAKDLANKHGIAGVPTFIFVAQGKKIDEQVGVRDPKTFKDGMRDHLRKHFPKTVQTSIDASSPAQQNDAEIAKEKEAGNANGIVETIIAAVKQIIDLVMGLIKYVIDAVKGLFGH